MSKPEPKYSELSDTPMPSPTWKPDPSSLDLDPQPLPDAVDLETESAGVPPARSGPSEDRGNPVEGAGKDNPIHHTGRVPSSPLAK